jgi:hypothetical protein
MELEFPFEFIVLAAPVSAQRANSTAREAWKEEVRRVAKSQLPEGHFLTDKSLSVTFYYYPETAMIGDLDNVIKLTLDAMNQNLYIDDSQIERIVIQKFDQGRVFSFSDPSPVLARCMIGPRPAFYVRLSDDPYEELRT